MSSADERAARLAGYPPVSATTIHGGGAALFALPFLGVGAFLGAAGLGLVALPAESLRAPLWTLGLLGAAFGLAGSSLLAHGLGGLLKAGRLADLAATHPREPWRGDHEWEGRRLVPRERPFAFGALAGGGAGLALLAVLNAVVFGDEAPWTARAIVVLFDVLVAAGLGELARRAAQRARHGRVEVVLERFPVHPGDVLRGVVRADADLARFDALRLTLRCVEEAYEATGRAGERSARVVCAERFARTLEARAADVERGALAFAFALPADAPTTALAAHPARFWDLELVAEREGLDLEARFLVPIYADASARRAAA
ncbi:MAG: hypothetical protein H6828_03245 [Planctomycetes bacterium]|nr:hypothetical protein [Planctomycetota bacterium]